MALRTESYTPRTAPSLTTAVTAEVTSQLRASALAAEIDSEVTKLRDLLHASAQRDKLGLCKSFDPNAFYPHGTAAECRARQVRHQGSEFRKGVRYKLQGYLVNERRAAADALIAPLAQMIMTEAPSVSGGEALGLIADDYNRVFGSPPPSSVLTAAAPTTSFPSRIPSEVTPTPLPQVPGEESGTQLLPGVLPKMPSAAPTPVPEGMAPMPGPSPFVPAGEQLPTEPAQPGVAGIPWMWIGVGAAALGGIYFLTRGR